jgi:serine/threonine protein kinase
VHYPQPAQPGVSFTVGAYSVFDVVLGSGAFSEVRLGQCMHSNQLVAIKCIPRHKISADAWKRIEKEYQMLEKLRG